MRKPSALRTGAAFGGVLAAAALLVFVGYLLMNGVDNITGADNASSYSDASGRLLEIGGLVMFYLAGRSAARASGRVGSAALAGTVTAVISSLAYSVAYIVWVISIPLSEYTSPIAQALGIQYDPSALRDAVIQVAVASAVIFVVLAIGAGAGVGWLAGLIERGALRQRVPPSSPPSGYPSTGSRPVGAPPPTRDQHGPIIIAAPYDRAQAPELASELRKLGRTVIVTADPAAYASHAAAVIAIIPPGQDDEATGSAIRSRSPVLIPVLMAGAILPFGPWSTPPIPLQGNLSETASTILSYLDRASGLDNVTQSAQPGPSTSPLPPARLSAERPRLSLGQIGVPRKIIIWTSVGLVIAILLTIILVALSRSQQQPSAARGQPKYTNWQVSVTPTGEGLQFNFLVSKNRAGIVLFEVQEGGWECPLGSQPFTSGKTYITDGSDSSVSPVVIKDGAFTIDELFGELPSDPTSFGQIVHFSGAFSSDGTTANGTWTITIIASYGSNPVCNGNWTAKGS